MFSFSVLFLIELVKTKQNDLSVEICLGLRQETKTFIFDEFSLLFFAEASSDHVRFCKEQKGKFIKNKSFCFLP